MMGRTGVGKSHFINVARGEDVALVNHSMEPGTAEINKYVVREKQPNKPRIVLVDTPGFGNPHFSSDKQILHAVLRWTETKCCPTSAFGGIIYLTKFPSKSEPFLRELADSQEISQVLNHVVVEFANRKDQPNPNGQGMTKDRLHFVNTHGSAWKIIDLLASNQTPPQIIDVQDEFSVRLGILGRISQGGLNLLKTRTQNKQWLADVLVKNGKDTDIIVPVIGPSGSGKSTFINNLLSPGKRQMKTTEDMESCTTAIESVVLECQDLEAKHPFLSGRRLVIVDTPGFNDVHEKESEILRRITVWLASSYHVNMKLGGVILLRSVSLKKEDRSIRANFKTFQELCGRRGLRSVVLVTTMWGVFKDGEPLERHHGCLATTYWKDMVEYGSTVHKLTENGQAAAWAILDLVLGRIKNLPAQIMPSRREMVDLERGLPDIAGGKGLPERLQTIQELRHLTRTPTFSSDENISSVVFNSKVSNRPFYAPVLPSIFQREKP